MSTVTEHNQSGEMLAGPGQLFEKIRNYVSTPQGRGQVFERLIKIFLKENPLFKERFSQVWLWNEWPGRGGEHDSGIDLVGEERDGGYCAIQCKFYDADSQISRSDIDTFLARSGKAPFTSRLFVSTTEHWTTTAEKVLADQFIPVQRIGIAKEESQNEDNPLITTYQSLDRVSEAQSQGAPVFDLIVADEAHRTTGALAKDEGYSGFTMVHDNESLRGKKRLYMTATPRLYSDRVKAKAKESDVVLCSMDDESLYGEVLHHLGFGKAVEAGLLSDYRVVVLMIDEEFASKAAHEPLADVDVDLVLEDAARLVGVWRGLPKQRGDAINTLTPISQVVGVATSPVRRQS